MQITKVTARRLKFWWSLSIAYITRYKLLIVSALILITALGFLSYKIIYSAFKPNVLTVGYIGTYSLENIPAEILSLATDSLVAPDENGRPMPILASHWTVTEDGKEYVLFLKDNLKWNDGTVLQAKDISIAMKNVEITAINNKAIQFKLPNPIPSFPLLLNKPVFKANTFYGTSNYLIVNLVEVENVVKKISMHSKDPSKPEVEIKFYTSEELALNALKIGEIKHVNIANTQGAENWPNLTTKIYPNYSQIMTIFFNTQDEFLANREFRQALNYAINTQNLNGEAASGPISPKSWAYNNDVGGYEYNIGKAKELIAKSQIKNPSITLKTTKDLQAIAYQIKEDWDAMGISTSVVVEKQVPTEFQALLVLNKLDPDPDQYALWHSTQTESNISNFHDVRIDKYLEDGRGEQDENSRKDIYTDFQNILLEEAPAAFLYYPYEYQITFKNVQRLFDKLPELK